MKEYDKIILASEILVNADSRLRAATSDMDYISSILLSGAVIGIIQPLLKEKNTSTSHQTLARVASSMSDSSSIHEGFFRTVYNSLKHSGNKKGLKPSEDLIIFANLRNEAISLIEEAKVDFHALKLPIRYNNELFSDEFLNVMQSFASYKEPDIDPQPKSNL